MFYQKKYLLIAVASSLLSLDVYSQGEVTTDLHSKPIAEAEYDEFKLGNRGDPLESIRNGYKESYTNELNGGLLEQKNFMTKGMMDTENQRVGDFISSLERSKAADKRELYENSLNEDGSLNHEAYSTAYTDYLSGKRLATDNALGDRDSFALGIFNKSNQAVRDAGFAHANNANVASKNIIDVINSKTISYADTVRNNLDGVVNATRAKVPEGEETVVLAYEFNGECGDTCEFPTPPPPVDVQEPAPECLYDDSNYIYEYESDHSEYGTWEEKDYELAYFHNGITVYDYVDHSTNRGGTWVEDVSETGSKSGYTLGAIKETEYSGGNYGGSEFTRYEICVE